MAILGAFTFVGGEPVLDYRIHPEGMSRGIDPERYTEANEAVFGNGHIQARLDARTLRRLRGDWQRARHWALGSLSRDAHNPRAVMLLLCALAGRAPTWVTRRLGAL